MKKLIILLNIIVMSFILLDCAGKSDTVEIKSLDTFEDPAVKFSLKYPSNWFSQSVTGSRYLVFTDKNIRSRFTKYDALGASGAKIEILISQLDSNTTLDSVIANKLFQNNIYSKPENVTIDGVAGIKQTYEFELEDGIFHGEVYYATKDNQLATTLYFEAFSGSFEAYKKNFDEILASLKLAYKPEVKSDTVFQEIEAEPPSMEFKTKSGEGFSIGIPDNFRKEKAPSQGALKTYNYMGMRRGDCFIRVDLFDASKSTDLKKIVDENKGKFGGVAGKKTTLSGVEAYIMNYKASGKVKGRVWFALKNDKLYRVMLNWFVGEEKDFLPPFEKSVKTFKFQ